MSHRFLDVKTTTVTFHNDTADKWMPEKSIVCCRITGDALQQLYNLIGSPDHDEDDNCQYLFVGCKSY